MAQTDECSVEIEGGPPDSPLRMYPGELAEFRARMTGGNDNANYTWTVEGPIIKKYDNQAYNATNLTNPLGIDDPTPMSPNDFQNVNISFYWQPNTTDTNRTVTIHVQTVNGEMCDDSKNFVIARSSDDIDLQAEDFYVETKQSFGNRNISSPVLLEHQSWHINNSANGENYNGTEFLKFHHRWLRHFDNALELFGYPRITPWNPDTPIPRGVEIDHLSREVNKTFSGENYYPHFNETVPEYFRVQPNSDGPVDRPKSTFANETHSNITRPCEIKSAPDESSQFPQIQDALNDFEENQELLGCALTSQYHNSIHGDIGQFYQISEDRPPCPGCNIVSLEDGTQFAAGDMLLTSRSPADPIFKRLHAFIDGISLNRTKIDSPVESIIASGAMESIIAPSAMEGDRMPPRVISHFPYGEGENRPITKLPVISEQEKNLFGVYGIPAISVEFNEPVFGLKADDLSVNGSRASMVNDTYGRQYVFAGFKSPGNGLANITLPKGNITDKSGNQFGGSSWQLLIVGGNQDNDEDGLQDELEINRFNMDPTNNDTDGDTIPDGFELASTTCLDPLESDSHFMDIGGNIISDKEIDSDRDGVGNVKEFRQGTDPCQKPHRASPEFIFEGIMPETAAPVQEPTNLFAIVLKTTDSGAHGSDNSTSLSYDSLTKETVYVTNGSKIEREIASVEEDVAKRTVNNSGFFDAQTFYPPAPGNTDFIEYIAFAILNGKIHAVYWTDASPNVPDAVKNLPFALTPILGV